VTSIVATAATGMLTVLFDAAKTGMPAAGTLTFTPGVANAGAGVKAVALADGLVGSIDWGCSSATQAKANLTVTGAVLGTVPAKYAPSECR
jgi:type IV pilus assembly protein PilA